MGDNLIVVPQADGDQKDLRRHGRGFVSEGSVSIAVGYRSPGQRHSFIYGSFGSGIA
jgi:hypothetical protein